MLEINNIKLKNSIVIAPMAGITDWCYRKILSQFKPGMMYSEMISVNAINMKNEKTLKMLDDCKNSKIPLIVQLFGSDIKQFVFASKYIETNIKPFMIDINMGCPVRKVATKSNAGVALMKKPEFIKELILSLKKNVCTPISIKIRSGWDNNINALKICKIAIEAGVNAIAIHPRTKEQGYSGKANWKLIKEIKNIANIPIIANGDVTDYKSYKNIKTETNCDLVMIGRAVIGNPWLIKNILRCDKNKAQHEVTIKQRKKIMLKHFKLLNKHYDERVAINEFRLFFSHYLKYFKQRTKYIIEFNKSNNYKDCIKIIKNIN